MCREWDAGVDGDAEGVLLGVGLGFDLRGCGLERGDLGFMKGKMSGLCRSIWGFFLDLFIGNGLVRGCLLVLGAN